MTMMIKVKVKNRDNNKEGIKKETTITITIITIRKRTINQVLAVEVAAGTTLNSIILILTTATITTLVIQNNTNQS